MGGDISSYQTFRKSSNGSRIERNWDSLPCICYQMLPAFPPTPGSLLLLNLWTSSELTCGFLLSWLWIFLPIHSLLPLSLASPLFPFIAFSCLLFWHSVLPSNFLFLIPSIKGITINADQVCLFFVLCGLMLKLCSKLPVYTGP